MLASCGNELRDRTLDFSPAAHALRARDPDVIAATARIFGPVADRVFRYELRGLDRIPSSPCLLVGNHSGGGVVEVPCTLLAWHRRFGERRPGYGLTNVLSLGYPVIGGWLRAIGGIDASYENARASLAGGYDTLVYPGGDIDSFRPFYQTRSVNFGTRRGYIRLALEMNVPILPIATIGSHLTYWMMPGNAAIARMLGLKRTSVRLESVPLTLGTLGTAAAVTAAAVGVVPPSIAALTATFAALPMPTRITSEALPAIDLAHELRGVTDPDERVERGHELVLGALRSAVQKMKHPNRRRESFRLSPTRT